jgi:hypothetical protein
MKYAPFSQTKSGSNGLLCAHGWAGQAQHLFSWRRISQSEIRNSAAAKARSGENSFPPAPFLFARPSVQFLPREARQSVGILFKKGSSFVQ